MRRLEVDLDGPLVYADHGGAGETMVLLHGIGGARLSWDLIAPLLAARFHVLAIDLPGFGESPLAGRKAGLEDQADLVARFIAQVGGGRAAVCGHSMGGLITVMLAARHPAATSRVVLFDPAFPPTSGSPAPGISRLALDLASTAPRLSAGVAQRLVRARGARATVVDGLRRSCADFSALPEGFVEDHVAFEAERMRHPGAYEGYLQAWASIRNHFDHRDRLDDVVRKVTAPTLLVHGELDALVLPEAARHLHELQPGWTVEFIPGIGHSPNFEAPAASAALILGWMDRTPG